MSIIFLSVGETAQVGESPRRNKLVVSDSLLTLTTPGYLNGSNTGGRQIFPTDVFDVLYNYTATSNFASASAFGTGTYQQCTVTIGSGNVITLVSAESTSVALNSATPGTVRALVGAISNSTLMTSGNIVGVRGQATYVGASGGFIYGTQGKIICTGALTSSEWSAGLFGQLDVSAATINAGQISAVWADWGTTGATATSMTGARLYAGTNTTANILNAQMYLYGPATNFLELDDNSGAYGATYFVAAGSGSSSAGNAGAAKVLKITVNGTAYYIGLWSSNS